MKGNLKITKTSSDGKVEGFTFRVTGVNGYDRSFTTYKKGEIVIEGLRIGEYKISEVMTTDAFDKEKQETVAAGMNSPMAKLIEPAVLYEVLADCRKGNENKVFFLCRR